MADQKTNGTADRGKDEFFPAEMLKGVAAAIRGIRFGSIEIVIQDGKVVQVERKEKLRFENLLH